MTRFDHVHGEVQLLNIDNPQVRDLLSRLELLTNDVFMCTMSLNAGINEKDRLIRFPCKQCLKNMALQCSDLSNALNELVDMK